MDSCSFVGLGEDEKKVTSDGLHSLPCAVLSLVRLFLTPWTVAHQAPLSMGILQEWVAMPSSRGSSQTRD